jgi:predicted DNA-binding WGR domain protein
MKCDAKLVTKWARIGERAGACASIDGQAGIQAFIAQHDDTDEIERKIRSTWCRRRVVVQSSPK